MFKKLLAFLGGRDRQEVEEILNPHPISKYVGVVVGEVLAVNPHPNADRLRLAKVDTGKEVLDIVCGAANLAVGQKVATALAGTKLPNGMEIKDATIRGQASHGMLCAEDELAIGEDHTGIIVLSPEAKAGEDIDKYIVIQKK